uniref:Probable cytosolic iron-sulfur protein assembly protein CIAO1 homolog n=1 Tax=Percolomonas cosmopolitus TaxID=63605 RepID=A0A7S1KLZ9_9EUKA|mmetsp:Transcript_10547/g.39234  ORF Transcript_10547/g.39234 Transcript_10547/m.39234 type:complete len:413 (+) Transcript_10547:38-1276(+)
MSLTPLTTLPLKSPVWSVSFHPSNPNTLLLTQKNEALIYSVVEGGDVLSRLASETRWRDAENNGIEDSSSSELHFTEVTSLNAHSRTVRRAVWEPVTRSSKGTSASQNPKIALCSFDGTVSLWKKPNTSSNATQEPYEIQTCLEGHENEVKSVKFADRGIFSDDSLSYIATCARDRTVWVWAKEERSQPQLSDSDMEDMEEDDDDEEDYEVVAVCNGHTQDVKDVMWHRTEPILLSCSYDDTIRTWIERLDDWFCCNILRDHTSTVWSMCQNTDGSLMASVSDDLSLIIWQFIKYTDEQKIQDEDRPFTYEPLCRKEQAHERSIYAVAWSPDERCIVTVGGDNALRVWTLPDASQRITCQSLSQHNNTLTLHCEFANAHDSDVNCVEFYQGDSRLLVTGSDDESVKIWKLVL